MNAADDLEGADLSVVEGRDGWLFVGRHDHTDVMSLYSGESPLSPLVVAEWARALTARCERFAGDATTYRTLVVPDAHLVYADKLPDGVTPASPSPWERVVAELDDAVAATCVYPRAELIAGRERRETWIGVDNHWSDWGAYIGYRVLMSRLFAAVPSVRVLQESELEWSRRPAYGTLGSLLDEERSVEVDVARVRRPRARMSLDLLTDTRDGYQVLEQDAPELPTAVFVRDSFMTAAAKYVAESFRRVVLVSTPNSIPYDLLAREKPDVVIHELVESRLPRSLREPSMLDFRTLYGDLLLDDDDAVDAQRRSRALQRMGRPTEALAASDAAIARARPTARQMAHRAQLHRMLGNDAAGLEALRHATSLDPTDGGVWYFLGQALGASDRPEESFRAFQTACAVEPGLPEVWSGAVSACLSAGNSPAAVHLAVAGLQHHPGSAMMMYAAATAFAASGRPEEAVALARRAVGLEPTNRAYLTMLADLLDNTGDEEKAAPLRALLSQMAARTAATETQDQ